MPTNPFEAESPEDAVGSRIQNWKTMVTPAGVPRGRPKGTDTSPSPLVGSGTMTDGSGTMVPCLKGALSSEKPMISQAKTE